MKGNVGKVTAAVGVTFCLILSAWLLAADAPWSYSLWALLVLATGILIGSHLGKRWSKLPYLICVLVTTVIVGYVIVRKLPIHSLDWAQYRIAIFHGDATEEYFIFQDAIGTMPGGFAQSIFVPGKPGLDRYVADLLEKHGHAR